MSWLSKKREKYCIRKCDGNRDENCEKCERNLDLIGTQCGELEQTTATMNFGKSKQAVQ
jgi:predicted amidophosphoribosyltransferase